MADSRGTTWFWSRGWWQIWKIASSSLWKSSAVCCCLLVFLLWPFWEQLHDSEKKSWERIIWCGMRFQNCSPWDLARVLTSFNFPTRIPYWQQIHICVCSLAVGPGRWRTQEGRRVGCWLMAQIPGGGGGSPNHRNFEEQHLSQYWFKYYIGQ